MIRDIHLASNSLNPMFAQWMDYPPVYSLRKRRKRTLRIDITTLDGFEASPQANPKRKSEDETRRTN
jgi:hypothetical protein